jgi:ATP-binding cassette, subfamily B, bacterial MsbA
MNTQLYKRLFRYLLPYKKKLLVAIFFSVVVGVIATSPVPLIQKTFDDIFVEKNFFMLKVIPIGLVFLYTIKAFLVYFQNIIILGITWELVVSMREKLFTHIHKLPFTFFEDNETGQLMSRIMNDVNIMQSTITRMLKEFIQNGITLIALLGWIFYLKWDWALISILILPIMILPIGNIARKLKKLSHKGQEILADLSSTILESFSGVKVVRAFGMEDMESQKFNSFSGSFLNVMKKNVKYVEIPSPFLELLGVISASVILWYGGFQVLTDKVSQGTFLAFIVGLFMMYAPVRLLIKLYANIQSSLAAAERVFSVLDLEEEKINEGNLELFGLKKSIEYQSIAFKYPSRDTQVLSNINIVLEKSKILAIVGMSGSGKTSLVDLLFRFHDPLSGKILIDGINIKDYTLKSLRGSLSLVSQETFLFNDTIRKNIAYGRPDASEVDIVEAAKAAHVDLFANSFDGGYDTIIGERGVKLSGGQRQRISIARAILRNSSILVLDEATSALDSESEKSVQDALNNLMEDRTTFMIAHRLSTIKHADSIIVLDKGKIVEVGTHEKLLSNSGLYQKYYQMQIMNLSIVDDNN